MKYDTDANDAAFARANGTESPSAFGLTKREYFAALILQGMMANASFDKMGANDMFGESQRLAVLAAEKLIEELNK